MGRVPSTSSSKADPVDIIYSPLHQRHDPPHEFLEGRLSAYLEIPARAEIIQAAVAAAGIGPLRPPVDHGLEPVLAVHDAAYVEFLRGFHPRWVAAGGAPEAALPALFPGRHGFDRFSPSPWAEIGYYSLDCSAPITEGTYAAALESAQCALTAADAALAGAPAVYALCRPPGHHAAPDQMGGYCYFNNAAIAAHHLTARAGARVAVLDIDVHAGNGTQAIFYRRADVLFISLHGDPAWEYPHFAGYADEIGAGDGEGFNLNIPLARGTDDAAYLVALDHALARIRAYEPGYVVLSAGFDTFGGDPLGKFALTTPVYAAIGARVAALGVPVIIVQEGGYATAALGENAVSLLRGFGG